MTLRDAPATGRNREPIRAVLSRWIRSGDRVLELASGTGQHAVYFAEHFPDILWMPTEADPSALETIAAWTAESGLSNIAPPAVLDAQGADWAIEADAIFNANMIHIAPWSVALGLLAGAGRTLDTGGRLFLYGPFKVGGGQTSSSNADFDESLRLRDASWGIRDLETVVEEAEAQGLALVEQNEMPANNKLLIFERR